MTLGDRFETTHRKIKLHRPRAPTAMGFFWPPRRARLLGRRNLILRFVVSSRSPRVTHFAMAGPHTNICMAGPHTNRLKSPKIAENPSFRPTSELEGHHITTDRKSSCAGLAACAIGSHRFYLVPLLKISRYGKCGQNRKMDLQN